MSLLKDEVRDSLFDYNEKNCLLADWLYLISVNDYDEKQVFSLKELAAKLLGISEDAFFTL